MQDSTQRLYISRQSNFTLQSYTDHTQLTMAYGNRERTCLGSWPLAWPSEWPELCIPLWCPTHWAHCRVSWPVVFKIIVQNSNTAYCGGVPKIHQNHLIPAGSTGPAGPTGPNTAGPVCWGRTGAFCRNPGLCGLASTAGKSLWCLVPWLRHSPLVTAWLAQPPTAVVM